MIVINGHEFITLRDEIFLGPRNVISGKKTVSKTFSSNGYVLNVMSGPEDLMVIWTLYYNGTWWPNLVMLSTEKASVSFNTNGSVNSNQTSSPLTLGSGPNGGSLTLGGTTLYYNGVDYNGSYSSNELGWPTYTQDYGEVAESYGSMADSGTITGVVSTGEKVDTTNKVYEVWVNGIKVYPEGGGDTLYLIDTSGSSAGRQEDVANILRDFNYGKSYMLGSWTIDGQHCKVLCDWTTSFEEVLDAVLKSNLSGGNGNYDNDPTDVILNEYDEYQPNTIVVVGDYELGIGEEERSELDALIGESNLYLINIDAFYWNADSSYVFENENDELCYMDAGGFHRTYLKANDGAAMFALVYFPGTKITEVIGISPIDTAAAYKWPFNGPELTGMRTANGQYNAEYQGFKFRVAWYGGLYDTYGSETKDPVEWTNIPRLTVDEAMGDAQAVLDAIAEAAGLEVSYAPSSGWHYSLPS